MRRYCLPEEETSQALGLPCFRMSSWRTHVLSGHTVMRGSVALLVPGLHSPAGAIHVDKDRTLSASRRTPWPG